MTGPNPSSLALGLVLAIAIPGCSDTVPKRNTDEPNLSPIAQRLLVSPQDLVSAGRSDVMTRLRDELYAYFRFASLEWTAVACDEIIATFDRVPTVNLHGDAHIEQYAVTTTDRGLDDFDNTALGPGAIDLIRFVASLELVTEIRGWERSKTEVVDRFLEGYRAALEDPEMISPTPAIVRRIRAAQSVDVVAFIARAESLMVPLEGYSLAEIREGLDLVREMLEERDQRFDAEYMKVKSAGELRIGVGSALTPKLLLRLEGPTSSASDDIILEAKQMESLGEISCLVLPPGGEPFRVVYGATRVGRLDYEILAYVPWAEIKTDAPAANWFARSWDPSFTEIVIADLESPAELAELVFDAGVQLGEGHVRGFDERIDDQVRRAQLQVVDEFGADLRTIARKLVVALREAHVAYVDLAAALKPDP